MIQTQIWVRKRRMKKWKCLPWKWLIALPTLRPSRWVDVLLCLILQANSFAAICRMSLAPLLKCTMSSFLPPELFNPWSLKGNSKSWPFVWEMCWLLGHVAKTDQRLRQQCSKTFWKKCGRVYCVASVWRVWNLTEQFLHAWHVFLHAHTFCMEDSFSGSGNFHQDVIFQSIHVDHLDRRAENPKQTCHFLSMVWATLYNDRSLVMLFSCHTALRPPPAESQWMLGARLTVRWNYLPMLCPVMLPSPGRPVWSCQTQ